jgi:uncharacterized metal-binding protein YceD (DUF177 family)
MSDLSCVSLVVAEAQTFDGLRAERMERRRRRSHDLDQAPAHVRFLQVEAERALVAVDVEVGGPMPRRCLRGFADVDGPASPSGARP